MKLYKNMVLIFVLLCLLCACAQDTPGANTSTTPPVTEANAEIAAYLSPDDKLLPELATTLYTESEIDGIWNFAETGVTFDQLNAKYPVQFMRKGYNGYWVYYRGTESVAEVYLNSKEIIEFRTVCYTNLNKADYSNLEIGDSLKKVMELDPKGDYHQVYMVFQGRTDVEPISLHYTKDGYLLHIDFNMLYDIHDGNEPEESFTISKITYFII